MSDAKFLRKEINQSGKAAYGDGGTVIYFLRKKVMKVSLRKVKYRKAPNKSGKAMFNA